MYLWRPDNEHHMVLVRGLTALDVSAFRADGISFIAVSTGVTIVATLVFRQQRQDDTLRRVQAVAWLTPMLLLTVPMAVCCSLPLNAPYPLTLGFLILSLVMFNGAEGFWRLGANAARSSALAAAVLWATLSVFWRGRRWCGRPGDGRKLADGVERSWLRACFILSST